MPLLINKPTGFTSHDVVAVVRKKLNIKKVGHAGTLDPMATGLLIVLVGRDETKQQDAFMAENKEYIAEITLGQISTTYDAEGEITVSGDPHSITQEQVQTVLHTFIGDIEQRPPIHSAVHIAGQRSYALARKGKITQDQIPARPVIIYEIELLEYALPKIRIRVACGKGTYIRSLAHDIGQTLGVGGYLSALQRTKIGNLSLVDAIELTDVEPDSLEKFNADGTRRKE